MSACNVRMLSDHNIITMAFLLIHYWMTGSAVSSIDIYHSRNGWYLLYVQSSGPRAIRCVQPDLWSPAVLKDAERVKVGPPYFVRHRVGLRLHTGASSAYSGRLGADVRWRDAVST